MLVTRGSIHLRQREESSHKGENGKVLVVGGSIDYVGAIILAGMAAFRSGVDNVTVLAPQKIALSLNFWPDLITVKYPGSYFKPSDAQKAVRLARDFDVLLIGNGVGRRPRTLEFCRKVIRGFEGRKVIDADALKAIRLQDACNSVLTPHRGEFDVLLANSRLSEAVFRRHLGDNVLLLKGRVDSIISRSRIARNRTGNAGMTVGGTGDVLAGLCAGLASQGNSLFESACAAAYVNGAAGDALLKQYGYGFTATDLVDRIASILRHVVMEKH